MLDALAFGGEGGATVEAVHGAVEGLVGLAEIGRHEVRVVEVGQRTPILNRPNTATRA